MKSFPVPTLETLYSGENTAAGLGLRREIIKQQLELKDTDVDFFEIAPENWIGVGGHYGNLLRQISERFELTLHGLSLNIGGYAPLDFELLRGVKSLMQTHNCALYSEHLSYCADDAHIYDLLPIPFTQEALEQTVERILQVQDFLGQRIALENSSYYTPLASELSEIDFITELLHRADCDMLLDVNNVYVNSINHRYDAQDFIRSLPKEKIRYMHIAGHFVEAEDLRVDTHGSDVISEVFELLAFSYAQFGHKPTLLERGFNFPEMPQLLEQINEIKRLQKTTKIAA